MGDPFFGDDWLIDDATAVAPEPHAFDVDPGDAWTLDAPGSGLYTADDPYSLQQQVCAALDPEEDEIPEFCEAYGIEGYGIEGYGGHEDHVGTLPVVDPPTVDDEKKTPLIGPEGLSPAAQRAADVITSILSEAASASTPEAAAQAAAQAAVTELTPEGSPLRAIASSLPRLSASRGRGGWPEPSDWTDADLRSIWDSAQKSKNLVLLQPKKHEDDVEEVMGDIAATDAALKRSPIGMDRAKLAGKLRELAAGLFLNASYDNGQPVTTVDPANLAGAPVIYLATVNGVQFDLDGMAFATKARTYAAILRSKAERLAGDGTPMNPGAAWDTAVDVWDKGESKGALAFLGIGAAAVIGLLALAKVKR